MSIDSEITIYGDASCSYCAAARMFLTRKGVKFLDVLVSKDAARLDEMVRRSGQRSVPQIFIGDTRVGGFDELCALDKNGELDKLLTST